MKLTSAIIALVVLTGCAWDRTVDLDNDFTPTEVSLIIEAAEHWQRACDCSEADLWFNPGALDDGDMLDPEEWGDDVNAGRVWKLGQQDPVWKNAVEFQSGTGEFDSPPNMTGMQSYRRMALAVDAEEDSEAYFFGVTLHEFGHWFGLEHDVMPSHEQPQCVDVAMHAELCRNLDCGPNAGPTCERE